MAARRRRQAVQGSSGDYSAELKSAGQVRGLADFDRCFEKGLCLESDLYVSLVLRITKNSWLLLHGSRSPILKFIALWFSLLKRQLDEYLMAMTKSRDKDIAQAGAQASGMGI